MTAAAIRARKGAERIAMITAYDHPTAKIVDAAGVDIILIGDTMAEVILGYEETLAVTIDVIAHHVGAVARARPRALVVGDLPWMSYHVSTEETVVNAARLVRAGADVVKLEGGKKRLPMIRAILDTEIPVMGHLGLTPQSVHAIGGYRVQGRDVQAARSLVEDARALADAGCFAIVLECVPAVVARHITASVPVPTIGIGSGPDCDGQVLVFHDVAGLTIGEHHIPKYVRRYAGLGDEAVDAISRYVADVRSGRFPNRDESYKAPVSVSNALDASS